MAEGKRKRSLREAFGVVHPPEEKSAPKEAAEGDSAAGPVGIPEGGSPAPTGEGEPEKKPAARKQSRTSPGGAGSGGGTRARRNSTNDAVTNDPVNTASRAGKGGGGRRRAASVRGGGEEAPEVVPGKGGKMVPAETPVNMTFTVTAKERYLWTLELKRRGLTAVGVLRETMEAMVGENRDG